MTDKKANIEALYISQRDKLVKYFLHRCDGNIMDAEDIVQEGFTRALTYIDSAPKDNEESVKNWLMRICHNCCKDLLREKRMGGATDIDDLLDTLEFNPQDESMRYARQLLKKSDKLTQGLDELTRQGVNLYFFKGYRCTDLQKLLGRSTTYWERIINNVRDAIVDTVKRQGYYSKGHWVPVLE